MRVRSIDLDDHGDPERVTVTMTTSEAAYLATLTGKQSPKSANDVVPGSGTANSDVYDCLTGDLFNRFYEGGVDEFYRRA